MINIAAADKYVLGDVEALVALDAAMPAMPPFEVATYQAHQRVNDRGVCVDVPATIALFTLSGVVQAQSRVAVERLTGGLRVTQTTKLREWVGKRLGAPVASIDAERIGLLLERPDLPDDVRQVLQCRLDAGSPVGTKLAALLRRVSSDGRLRGSFVHHQARTGRSSSRGFNLQNLPRPRGLDREQQDAFLTAAAAGASMHALAEEFGDVAQAIRDSMRGLLVASPGNLLVSADLSKAEPVSNTFFTGEADDPDGYKRLAARAHTPPVLHTAIQKDTPAYIMGKRTYLALTYGAGVEKILETLLGAGFKVTRRQVEEMVAEFNRLKARSLAFGDKVARACALAVKRGRIELPDYRGLVITHDPAVGVQIHLHSGRAVTFRSPRVTTRGWGKPVFEYRAGSQHRALHLGTALENVCSGTARDYMFDALVRAEQAGLSTVLHVHDQIVIDSPNPDRDAAVLKEIMTTPPHWLPELRIGADVDIGRRFSK